ncbi:MAG: response regulator [Nitrospirae bacterium]|nr:response regulator [Nitrospirota bacterium]
MLKKSILVVDNEAVVSLHIRNLLQGWGYKVAATVSTGVDAIAIVEQIPPDLILMDINIEGDIDGIETSKRIREKYNIPVIYLTAYADEAILRRVERTNPYGYILKPFHDSALYAAIKIALYNNMVEKDHVFQYQIQSVLNTILRISLEPISLTEQMDRILETIITLPWLKFESKGAIFLVKENAEVLQLKVQKGFSEELLIACNEVPFGKCLCGRAAAISKTVFADCIDDRHDITFDKMTQHGHFCVPIKLEGKLLGIFNLYLKDGHKKAHIEEEFLTAVSNTLAGIIARRGAEEALVKLKIQHELILNSAGEGIYGLNNNGMISFLNPAAAKMLGWTPAELLGKHNHSIIHHNYPDFSNCSDSDCHIHKTFKDGVVYRVNDKVFWRKDGSSFPVEYVSTPIFDENQQLVGAVVVFNDTSERKEADEKQIRLLEELKQTNYMLKLSTEKIIQSEKMAALGQLVSGVAHEINTPIGSSVLSASHLQEKTREVYQLFHGNKLSKSKIEQYFDVALEDSDIIVKNLLRSSAMVKSFKMVSGDQTSHQRRIFKLKEYVEEIIMSLKPMIKKTPHKIHIHCDREIELDNYPGAIAQIITNLIMNSFIHAFDEDFKGTINISIIENFNNVVLMFKDNGKGIPEGTLGKIFDPFFTTNRKGGNSGLGLHIVYNIVAQTLKGDIYCESVEGDGTTFVITIPKEVS